MPLYNVLSPLKHDATSYGPGETITLPETAAETLVARGRLEPAEPTRPSRAKPSPARKRKTKTKA